MIKSKYNGEYIGGRFRGGLNCVSNMGIKNIVAYDIIIYAFLCWDDFMTSQKNIACEMNNKKSSLIAFMYFCLFY